MLFFGNLFYQKLSAWQSIRYQLTKRITKNVENLDFLFLRRNVFQSESEKLQRSEALPCNL